jgi:hypothetical protein
VWRGRPRPRAGVPQIRARLWTLTCAKRNGRRSRDLGQQRCGVIRIEGKMLYPLRPGPAASG